MKDQTLSLTEDGKVKIAYKAAMDLVVFYDFDSNAVFYMSRPSLLGLADKLRNTDKAGSTPSPFDPTLPEGSV